MTSLSTYLAAKLCIAQVEGDVILVGFAGDEYGASDYLLLQRSCSISEQDRTLEIDKVCITYCDQLRSAYGGIERVCLKEGTLDVFLAEPTAKKLGCDHHLAITFPATAEVMTTVQRDLSQMFEDEPEVFIYLS